MQAVRFLAVGELLVDVVAKGAGHEARIRLQPGGSAFTAAVTAAAVGAEAAVVGAVGDDAAGRMVVAELAARGVRAEIASDTGPTGVFLVADGAIRVDRGVSRGLDLPERLSADALLVSGYLPVETIEAALSRADAPWAALDAARLDALPAGANAVIANEAAARRLTGMDAGEAARALGRRYRLACVTRGRLGAIGVLDGRVEVAGPAAVVDADVPGAGDAFAAATLVAVARGAGLAEALADGCRWGAQAAISSLA
jgi:ribokinase